MRTPTIVATGILLACGIASAQQTLTAVEIRAESQESVAVACASPTSLTAKDVERVLAISDPTQTSVLRKKLISAAGEACKAGIPKIQVSRGATGKSLTWKAME